MHQAYSFFMSVLVAFYSFLGLNTHTTSVALSSAGTTTVKSKEFNSQVTLSAAETKSNPPSLIPAERAYEKSNDTKLIWSDEKSKYTADDADIYLNGKKIEGADNQSFEVITQESFPQGPYNSDPVAHYSKDKNHVYYDGTLIEDADSPTFKVIWSGAIEHEQIYAKDKSNVYFQGKSLSPKADPENFRIEWALMGPWRVAGLYGTDKKHVYYKNKEVRNADAASFNAEYEDEYASDKDHVFLKGEMVPNANPKSFSFPEVPEG